MQIATEEAGRWWLLKIGFDPAWADCSPGTLLLSETVRYAARQRLKTYEFLGTVEPWTQIWTQNERRCVSVRVYPQSIRGAMSLGATHWPSVAGASLPRYSCAAQAGSN